jgi:hypothetical protein
MTVQGLLAVIYLINLQITHLPLQNVKGTEIFCGFGGAAYMGYP